MKKSMKYLIYRYFSDNLGKGLSLLYPILSTRA